MNKLLPTTKHAETLQMKNEANAQKSLGQIIWDALAPQPTAESCERAGKLVEAAVLARQPAASVGAEMNEEVIEGLAKVVYEGMFRGAREAGDTPPEWVERGNSDMQYAARKLARLYLDSHPEFFAPAYYVTAERPPTEADGDGLGGVLAWYMGSQDSQWIRVSWMDSDFARGRQPYWMPLPPAPVPAKTTEDEALEELINRGRVFGVNPADLAKLLTEGFKAGRDFEAKQKEAR